MRRAALNETEPRSGRRGTHHDAHPRGVASTTTSGKGDASALPAGARARQTRSARSTCYARWRALDMHHTLTFTSWSHAHTCISLCIIYAHVISGCPVSANLARKWKCHPLSAKTQAQKFRFHKIPRAHTLVSMVLTTAVCCMYALCVVRCILTLYPGTRS